MLIDGERTVFPRCRVPSTILPIVGLKRRKLQIMLLKTRDSKTGPWETPTMFPKTKLIIKWYPTIFMKRNTISQRRVQPVKS